MDLFFFLSIVVCLLFLAILISIAVFSIRNGISPMPSSFKAKNCLVSNLPPDLLSGKIYELGSGWGTLAYPLAASYPQKEVTAFETSPVPYYVSRAGCYFFNAPNLKFVKRDFYTISLDDAALIVCYLYPEAMHKLKVKFEQELKPGTWVVSNTFAIPGWKAAKTYEVPDLYHTKIYFYRIDILPSHS